MQQVVSEWLRAGPRVEEVLRTAPALPAAMLLVDLTVHERPPRRGRGATAGGDAGADPRRRDALPRLGRQLRERGLPALEVTTPEGSTAVAGRGEPAAGLRTGLLEVTRALTGRRSAAQARAYSWYGDPEHYLPAHSLFGELRPHDLAE